MLTGQRFPIVCVPTDYETEGLWPHLSTDLFCVATESMAETLRPRLVPEQRTRITGSPRARISAQAMTASKPGNAWTCRRTSVSCWRSAGAYLPRPYVHFRTALDNLLPYLHTFSDTLHFVFVAGNDAEYAGHLRRACSDLGISDCVTVLEYVEGMAGLMAASDLVICKSGGLTVTECLCAQVPMILLGRAYGQENANVRLLTAHGAAMHVTTWRELLEALRHVSRSPESARSMLVNGSFLRHPDAARDIACAAIELANAEKDPANPLYKKHFLQFYWGHKPAHVR